jgi:hypothetical protein
MLEADSEGHNAGEFQVRFQLPVRKCFREGVRHGQ